MENDVVRRAYLRVTASKGLIGSLTRFSKKSWVVLRQESHSSRARLEIFKDEDDVTKRQPVKIVGIDQISSIITSPEKKEIAISIGAEQLSLICSARADVDDWIRDIDCLRKNGRFINKRSSGDEGMSMPQYPDEETFRVKLRPSGSLLFHGPCVLEVQKDFERNLFYLALFSEDEHHRSIVKWQIDHIRQYGSNDVAFKFQSGSKSPTGVDWFFLETEQGYAPRIHRAVDYWARHIVDQASNIPGLRPTRPNPPAIPPPNRSRLPDSSGSPVPSPTTYEPLRPSPAQPPALYEDLNKISTAPPLPPSPHTPVTLSSSFPTNSAYQPLIKKETVPDTTYAGLNDVTRDRSVSMTGCATSSGNSQEYMRLNEATRNKQDTVYEGLSLSPR